MVDQGDTKSETGFSTAGGCVGWKTQSKDLAITGTQGELNASLMVNAVANELSRKTAEVLLVCTSVISAQIPMPQTLAGWINVVE